MNVLSFIAGVLTIPQDLHYRELSVQSRARRSVAVATQSYFKVWGQGEMMTDIPMGLETSRQRPVPTSNSDHPHIMPTLS